MAASCARIAISITWSANGMLKYVSLSLDRAPSLREPPEEVVSSSGYFGNSSTVA
jgi:hypothetical protein